MCVRQQAARASLEVLGLRVVDVCCWRVLTRRLCRTPRVDFNKDRSVSAKEMQRWIMEKTEEHFQEATNENKNSFHAVDPDGDGERGDGASAAPRKGAGLTGRSAPQVT